MIHDPVSRVRQGQVRWLRLNDRDPRSPVPAARTTIRSGQNSDGTAAERYLGCPALSERWSGVSSWTPQRVLDAAAAMEWVPGGAIELRTDDYRLIRYPDVVLDPTLRAAQVTWSRTAPGSKGTRWA